MKRTSLGLVHTSATMVPIFKELCSSLMPDVDAFHLVDESLIRDVIRAGELTDAVSERVINIVFHAEKTGADRILVTCSSIGRAVEAAAKLCSVPVLRVDQPMADRAVEIGKKIGIIATLRTTMDPTTDLVNRRAELLGREIQSVPRLCEGAFEALMTGDAEEHDAMVASALKELSTQVDVILMAQASMARVVSKFKPGEIPVPVLGSPPIAIEYLADQFSNQLKAS